MQLCEHMDRHVRGCSQCPVLPQWLSILVLRRGLSLKLELTDWVEAGWQQDPPHVSISPTLGLLALASLSFLMWVLGLDLRSSCLPGKHLTNWVISLALEI